jgi:hypothetical protein
MDKMLSDLASWSYAYDLLVSGYGFLIFLYWYAKSRRASAWYLYVMGLLFSMFISRGFFLVARYYLVNNMEDPHDELLFSVWWGCKSWLASIVMTIIAIHATWRLVSGRAYENNEAAAGRHQPYAGDTKDS